MPIRNYRPTSPGRRNMTSRDFSEVTSSKPEKSLLEHLPRTGGRNAYGNRTNRNIGGGSARRYRKIDFKREKDGVPARVKTIEYDPNRSANIALLQYADGEKRYILAPKGLKVGRTLISGGKVDPEVGNAMPLEGIPLGTEVHSVELYPGRGAQLGRAAGAVIRLMAREGPHAHLLLPSGAVRRVSVRCRATVGQVGNIEHQNVVIGKAGRSRWMGRRPHVRGTAMNPVDHPMGGGKKRRAGGRPSCSRTGLLSKGGKTRRPNKATDKDIIRGRKRGKFQK